MICNDCGKRMRPREHACKREDMAVWIDRIRDERDRHVATMAELRHENEKLREQRWAAVEESRKWAEYTGTLTDHPEGWDGPCWCAECMSYGAQDGALGEE